VLQRKAAILYQPAYQAILGGEKSPKKCSNPCGGVSNGLTSIQYLCCNAMFLLCGNVVKA